MATNPYPEGTTAHELWNAGHGFIERGNTNYVFWCEGAFAAAGREDRFLEGFDAGLEAAQEHGVAGDGRDWKEIATHLLAQVINRRVAGTWQTNEEDAVRNAVEYHRFDIRDHLDVARRHIDRVTIVKDTP